VKARLPHGGSEREPSGARPAADSGATNAGRRDTGAAHHANLRLEDHADVPPLRDDGARTGRPELEKLVEFERRQRQGRQELVKQKGMENGGQTRALTGKDKLYLSHSRQQRHAIRGSSSPPRLPVGH